jgi:fatty acid synthase
METGSLGEATVVGRCTSVLVFSGQDPQWAEGLGEALLGRPDVRRWCVDVLGEVAGRLAAHPRLVPALAAEGIDADRWLAAASPGGMSPGERAGSHVVMLGTALAHLASARVLAEDGLAADAAGVAALTGHSSGLLSAWLLARHGSDVPVTAAADALLALGVLADVARRHPDSIDDDSLGRVVAGDDVAAPMLAVSGATESRLTALVRRHATASVRLSLQNSWDRLMLSGPPADLAAWREAVADEGLGTEWFPSTASYHHPALEEACAHMQQRLREEGISFSGELRKVVVDPRDGSRHTDGDFTDRVVESMSCRPVRWADTMADLAGDGDTVVIDLGPSTVTAALTRLALRGTGSTVVAAGSRDGRRSLRLAAERPEPLADYARHLPRISEDGPHRVLTGHTDRTGRSAMVLPGMTPSTVDAPIVAAAANGGHVAELAGGGQVSPAILSERMEELVELLAPGHEVVFNALHLDPYLWGLHLGRVRLVQKARAAGAPICGVTVSAGIPERDDAVALLDELHELGIWLNAFKPGTVQQVRAVLDIARHTPHHVWVHLEGGRAGGHHSWVDLDDLLFSTYHAIRSEPNVTLCVGGGIGTPEVAAAYLDGTWALRHGRVRMPVDAVLLGTVAMAAAESTASPSVKAALVAAPGVDTVVAAGEVGGGVTSGRSGLGADIHYLDNHASRVADLLEDLAGDAEAVARRHDEIAEALAGTAKPWFGDLTRMSYVEMLERWVELCARGRDGRYEDGAWFDVTHRTRFLDLLRRAEARCCDADDGEIPSLFSGPADLDHPAKAVEQLVAAHPRAATTLMEPADVAHFLSVCDRPGKPVPFVAVIDAEVRRRYLSDSLWQAHCDLWDAEEVLVIPGPTAVAGITRADEPVAELLDRFDAEVADLLAARGAEVVREPLPNAVECLLSLAVVHDGDRMAPSPLGLLAPSGGWDLRVEGDTAVAEVRLGDEVARLRGPANSPEGTVELVLEWPAAAAAPGDGCMCLAIDVRRCHGVPIATVHTSSTAATMDRVLGMLVDAARGAAERHGDADGLLLGHVEVPDSVMTALWPEVFDTLRRGGVADGLLRLVHLRHRLDLRAGDAGAGAEGDRTAGGDARAVVELVADEGVPAGRMLRTAARLGTTLVEDTFLVRGASGPTDDAAHAGSAGSAGEGDGDGDGAGALSGAGAPDGTGDADGWVSTPGLHLGRAVRRAPRHPEAYAVVSGDFNPIHRSDLVARLAGLPGRIVHGMWTSSTAQGFLVDEVLGGRGELSVGWSIDFTDMVLPGEELAFTATRVAVRDGHRRIEVRVESARGTVAVAEAEVAPVPTAYVFPGQGIQARGMGLDALSRSAAARSVWERADRVCRERLGFSVLEVVRDNPKVLRVGAETHRHPAGVLNLTQFTQVAMATLAAAQVEELREAGALSAGAVIAGHSVGEYNALAAAGGVLPLDAVLGIVWARGTAMHHLVPRDAHGNSTYRMGVVRPHLAGLSADDAVRLVAEVAEQTGELCEIVNHNLRGRQYAVAGTVDGLAELERRLGPGESPGRAPFLLVPGIDVPFHSRALADGVAEFRSHLDAELPAEIDPALLVGRYVPNLHPEPFRLDRDYAEAVSAVCGGRACADLLAGWDALAARPARLARELLVELLAWQFASPVRWIETTDVLLAPVTEGGLGVECIVEVGVGTSPTLANLSKAAVAAEGAAGVEVLHVELDRDLVHQLDEEPAPPLPELAAGDEPATATGPAPGADDDLDEDWDGDAPAGSHPPSPARPASPAPSTPTTQKTRTAATAAAPTAPAGAATISGEPTSAEPASVASHGHATPQVHSPAPAGATDATVEDRPVGLADVVEALLAHETQVRPDQLGDDTIDQLVDGASSRRNQVLMDFGKELGIGAVDGAHEVPRGELVARLADLARGYRFPGPVLSAAMSAGLSAALGPLGAGPTAVDDHVAGAWGLGGGWAQRCRLEIALGTRDGSSRRGGSLRSLPRAASVAELVDAALAEVAGRLGVTVAKPVAEASGAVADAAELEALAERVGKAFSEAARSATTVLLGDEAVAEATSGAPAGAGAEAERLRLLDLEHGAGRAEAVAPVFDERAVRLFASSVAWARADLDHLHHGVRRGTLHEEAAGDLALRLAGFTGSDGRFDATVAWYRASAAEAGEATLAALFERIASGPTEDQLRWRDLLADRVVLVSGASPGSIGESVVARLLGAGATVVMVTSSSGRARRLAARDLERRHAGPGARLFHVRANLASFTDIDRLVEWLGGPVPDSGEHPGLPDVVLPFAASPVAGDVPDAGPANEVEMRVLLLGVERLVGRLAETAGARPGRSLTAVLPMSPNHGTFGGDGSYGSAKAGLEVLEARRRSEHSRWGRHCRIVGAEIGWVRGTGLMAANDSLAPVVEQQLGIRTFSASEMGDAIAALCGPSRSDAPRSARVDLTGGLASLDDPGALARVLRDGIPGPGLPALADRAGADRAGTDEVGTDEVGSEAADPSSPLVPALVSPPEVPDAHASGAPWPATPGVDADDMIVICGVAEVGPWGTGQTRLQAELLGEPGADGIVELARLCGLVQWRPRGLAGEWVDTETDEAVGEEDLVGRYRDEVLARCGIRRMASTSTTCDVEVFTDRGITLPVPAEAEARALATACPGATVRCEGGAWSVSLPSGTPIRVPGTVELPREVTAPIPEGMEPTALGLPVELATSVDRLAAWNMAVTAEAWRDAGCDPEEVLAEVHPARVGNTQGSGMGGMDSIRAMYVDPVRGVAHANDMLQEALGNVIAAHAMQSYVGGYGPMIHPVGACATAAVSLESAMDLIALGKADVVVAGGFDDLGPEGIVGFADMSATASSEELAAAGLEPSEMSRPGDRGRGGFVEGQGGGAMLVCRGSVASRLGLPVRAVVALARSHSDGVQTSIPAPGLGALAVAMGGQSSPLGTALAVHGLGADDIAVVSKHDTSTRANDPNEAAVHERIQELLGRSAGNPLRVVSQKALTGHAKGGAAAWQVAGICDMFDTSTLPGNPNLDSVDPDVVAGPALVVDDRALAMAEPPRAALLTSLGFGHVSAVVLLVHPDAFVAALPEDRRDDYLATVRRRRADTARLRRWARHGGPGAFRRPEGRRLSGDDAGARRAAELEMLADPGARLGPLGVYASSGERAGPGPESLLGGRR